MVQIKDILDAVEAAMAERFPGLTAYRNLTRKGFARPSFLVQAGKQTMTDATARTVDRSCEVKVTLFETVDDYHDSQIDTLADRLTAAMELFSGGALAVGSRYLDLGDVGGEVGYDFAQLTLSLLWHDDRALPADLSVPAREIDIAINVNEKEE